jgi:hypothetical protein
MRAVIVVWLAMAGGLAGLGGLGCLDAPLEPAPATARLVVGWDPLACGEPHRVVVELTGDDDVPISASVPCELGGLTLDVAALGVYRGRIYAWAIAAPIRSVMPIEVTIDQPIVQWRVATPP